MSLFLGNLSPRIHRNELENVFRRFGRCTVQLKDGYGFAVYEFPPNAEKALRALRGKIICGEPIILSWSNKQPRPFQRLTRGARTYEPRFGRNLTREEGYSNRRLETNGRQDFKMGIKQRNGDSRRLNTTDIIEEEANYQHNKLKEFAGDKHLDSGTELLDDGGTVEPDPVDNDRWGQEAVGPSDENEVGTGLEFDRYDPHRSHGKEDDEVDKTMYSGGSPNMENSQEKTGKYRDGAVNSDDFGNSRSLQTCRICGELGHKMRNCPQHVASYGKKFNRFNRRQDDDFYLRGRGKYDVESLRSKPRDRLLSGRDSMGMRQKASGSGKYQRSLRSKSPVAMKNGHEALRKNSRHQKRSRSSGGTLRRLQLKKPRKSVSSSLHSESRSRSHSRPSKSLSRSRSISVSFQSGSLRANSRSSSIPQKLKSKSSASTSRSSSSISLSLSVSLGQPLPSSNKMQMNEKGTSDTPATPQSKVVVIENGQSAEAQAASENSRLGNAMRVVRSEDAMMALPEDPISSFSVEADLNEVHVQPDQRNNNGNLAAPKILDEGNISASAFLDQTVFTDGSMPSQSIREKEGLERSMGLMAMEHTSTTGHHPEVPLSSSSRNLIGISSEEMYLALKCYGLVSDESKLSADDFSGSARLWPWEIIYYRRLKKGPISVENYARRVAQNTEFGIVDKYVRSSSGWGEQNHDRF